MTFDPVPFDLGSAVLDWLKVVGGLGALVLLVAVVSSLIVKGRAGPASVFRYIISGPVPLTGAVLGGAGGAAIGAYFGLATGVALLNTFADWFDWSVGESAREIASLAGAAGEGIVFLLVGVAMGGALADSLSASPRRVWAVAKLTWKEAFRRKALLVFVIFALLFMFGGWFISSANARPELQMKVHVSFVLKAISWLILPVALLLSCWGLPEEIKNRSLHTVVTKPARRNEIVLGRILGFSGIGTLLLVVMGLVGYFWTQRQIPQQARSNLTCRVPVYGTLSFTDAQGNPTAEGVNVGYVWEHRGYIQGATRARAIWEFRGISPEAMVTVKQGGSQEKLKRLRLETQFEAFRTHKGDVKTGVSWQMHFVRNTREKAAEALSSSPGFADVGALLADGEFARAGERLAEMGEGFQQGRLAVTGEQRPAVAEGFARFAELMRPFRQKHPDEQGIAGLVKSAERCSEAARTGDSQALGESLGALGGHFQSHAGRLAAVVSDLRVPYPSFEIREFKEHVLYVDPELEFTETDPETQTTVQRKVNLFQDVVHGGNLRIEVRCVDAGQYLGMARPDLFIRTPDRPFWVGYSKAIGATWLMMVLIVVLGVTAGSLLNGPVSTFLVFALLVVGQGFREFLKEMVAGQVRGGGLFESLIRIFKHLNPQQPLEENLSGFSIGGAEILSPEMLSDVVKSVDGGIINLLWLVSNIIPDFGYFGRSSHFVANGFDVDWASTLLPSVAVTGAFLLPGIVVGYYCLKLRELEQK